jgi:hypothetical protein
MLKKNASFSQKVNDFFFPPRIFVKIRQMNKASKQLDYQLAIIYVYPLEKYLQLIMVKKKMLLYKTCIDIYY